MYIYIGVYKIQLACPQVRIKKSKGKNQKAYIESLFPTLPPLTLSLVPLLSQYHSLLVACMQGGTKIGLQLWVHKKIILVLFVNYCITFYMNNCNPPFAPPCILYIYSCKHKLITMFFLSLFLTHRVLYQMYLTGRLRQCFFFLQTAASCCLNNCTDARRVEAPRLIYPAVEAL